MENLKYILSLWRFWVALVIVGALTWAFHLYAPPQHNPWRKLDLKHPIGFATYRKFTALKHEPETCIAALDAAELPYISLINEQTGQGCGFENAVSVTRILTQLNDELRMTCPMAAALYTWEHTSARPLAEDMFGTSLLRLETYGSYACRNIAGSRRRSEHAMANAIDIAGFRLADGRLVSVKTHWGTDTLEGRYLEHVHAQACRLFSVVLGPDYNAAHADHFHFDFGSGSTCR